MIYRDATEYVQALRVQARGAKDPTAAESAVLLVRLADGNSFVETPTAGLPADLTADAPRAVESWDSRRGERVVLLRDAEGADAAYAVVRDASLADQIYAVPASISMVAVTESGGSEETAGCSECCTGLGSAPAACLAFGCLYWTFILGDGQ